MLRILSKRFAYAAAPAGAAAFYLQTRKASAQEPPDTGALDESPGLSISERLANYISENPVKSIFGTAIPAYLAVYVHEATAPSTRDMLFSQRLIHTRVYGQARQPAHTPPQYAGPRAPEAAPSGCTRRVLHSAPQRPAPPHLPWPLPPSRVLLRFDIFFRFPPPPRQAIAVVTVLGVFAVGNAQEKRGGPYRPAGEEQHDGELARQYSVSGENPFLYGCIPFN